jgi:hypothetical protein
LKNYSFAPATGTTQGELISQQALASRSFCLLSLELSARYSARGKVGIQSRLLGGQNKFYLNRLIES